jgi:hypothetical protein
VSFGPYEFKADGTYHRQQDIASAIGRYTIANGRICMTFEGPWPSNFCLEVLKTGDHYVFRHHSSATGATALPDQPVTPCPLPNGR